MIDLDHATRTVDAYLRRHPAERDRLGPLLAALPGPAPATSRATVAGHLTCSALLFNPGREVLHIRHRVLDRWLPPGGHLDEVDDTLMAAAVREAAEETGIPAAVLRPYDDLPLDIDVHRIPANPARGEPEHWHFDACYAFAVPAGLEPALQAEEVSAFRWLPVARIEPAAVRGKVLAALGPPAAAAARPPGW